MASRLGWPHPRFGPIPLAPSGPLTPSCPVTPRTPAQPLQAGRGRWGPTSLPIKEVGMGRPGEPGLLRLPVPMLTPRVESRAPSYPRTRSHSLCRQSLAWFPATESGRERASAASSVGAGPAMPARDAGKGGRVPSPLNLHNRAGIIKGEHPCPTGASAWVCCAPGGGGKDQQVPVDPPAEGAGSAPSPRCALALVLDPAFAKAVGTAGLKALGAGAPLAPPSGIPLSFGVPLDFRGAGHSLRGRLCP